MRRQGPWGPVDRYRTAHATSHGQRSTSWSRNELALHADPSYDMLQRSLLAQDQFQPTPLFAGAKAYPRAAQNGPYRRESAAETTSWVPAAKIISDSSSAVNRSHGPEHVPGESSSGLSPTSWPRGAHAATRDRGRSARKSVLVPGPDFEKIKSRRARNQNITLPKLVNRTSIPPLPEPLHVRHCLCPFRVSRGPSLARSTRTASRNPEAESRSRLYYPTA